MKYSIIYLVVCLIPALGMGQNPVANTELVKSASGHEYVIVNGDTLADHRDYHKAIQTAFDYAEQYNDADIRIVSISETRLSWDKTVMADESIYTRNINHMILQDSLAGFVVRLTGSSPAEKVVFASKCIGIQDSTGIDERHAFAIDSTASIDAYSPRFEQCNQLMTIWLTAYVDGEQIAQAVRFEDIAIILSL